jgi:hypothetical protein
VTANTDWGVLNCIGRGHRMMILEDVIRTLSNQGATFMTMRGVAEDFDRRNPFASG